MKLDSTGVLVSCPSCGTTNRLQYAALEKATKCGKCQTAIPFLAEPIEVPNTQLFDAAVSKASIPIVVDFWAAWCGPCRMVAPEVAKAAATLSGRALVLKVDTDANAELSQRFGIRSIPTIAVFRDGREITRVAGVRPAAAIAAMVTQQAA